jgi:hypothetical protein
MEAKEKAKELVNKYMGLNSGKLSDYSRIEFPTAKQCALIAIDEILKAFYLNTGSDIVGNHVINFAIRESNYWEEVKKEIEKL